MRSNKLTSILQIISEDLTKNKIPFCLIGAMALGLYGLPRFTADIDLLTENNCWPNISLLMKELGYKCYQKTDVFARFDSALKAFSNVDFMFVSTKEGKDIIKRSAIIKDRFVNELPVIQPTDYIILKLMAIANNPERNIKDEADISRFFELYNNNLLPGNFESLNKKKIFQFADKFNQRALIEKYFASILPDKGHFVL